MLNGVRIGGADVIVWGRNASIGTSLEELYAYDQAMDWATQFAAAGALDVSSSSANDAAAGTGARTIEVVGLDASYKVVRETITLNGQTPVTGSQAFLRVFGAEVKTAGTGLVNAGDIHIVKTGTGGAYGAGVPPTLTSAACKILAGWGSSFNGFFTVPAGESYMAVAISGGSRTQLVTMVLQEFEIAGTDPAKRVTWSHEGNNAAFDIDLRPYRLAFGEKTDVRLRVQAAVAGGICFATLALRRLVWP